jgi:hypothetical protein
MVEYVFPEPTLKVATLASKFAMTYGHSWEACNTATLITKYEIFKFNENIRLSFKIFLVGIILF